LAFRQAPAIFLKATGPDHPLVAMSSNNEGEVLNALHRHPEAQADFERAVEIWNAQHADAATLAYAETGLGLALLGQARPKEAIPPLEQALAARTAAKEPAELMGETTFALARALWSSPAGRSRALQLARFARAEYASLAGTAARDTAARIEHWLRVTSSSL